MYVMVRENRDTYPLGVKRIRAAIGTGHASYGGACALSPEPDYSSATGKEVAEQKHI